MQSNFMTPATIDFFNRMLQIDSTSGREKEMALWLAKNLKTRQNEVELMEVGDGSLNVMVKWGTPRIVFCTHCDTVAPYISPTVKNNLIEGRGTCDAKGQILSMFMACKALEEKGQSNFALLILSGEETGSHGAKAFDRLPGEYEFLVVGEPTDNKMVEASKGTHAFHITINGRPCHSGYPDLGESAVKKFVDFYNALSAHSFTADEQLGNTTWNIGTLYSPNPQNILSGEVSFNLYFRTTFASANEVAEVVRQIAPEGSVIEDLGGDTPSRYFTLPGFETTTASFGSDAPHLTHFKHKILCGAGSIEVAHTHREFVYFKDLEYATALYMSIAEKILTGNYNN